MFSRLLSNTRFSIIIAVVGAWLAALLTMLLGIYEIGLTVLAIPKGLQENALKGLVINLIEGVDLFLLSAAFYLTALGLYELFIDNKAELPDWLVIHNLDDLKSKLVKVLVVVLGVQFVALALSWKGGVDIVYIGVSVALVILALSIFLGAASKNK